MLTLELPAKAARLLARRARQGNTTPSALVERLVLEHFGAARECPLCRRHGHRPNAETVAALEEAERGEGFERFENVDALMRHFQA